MRRLAARLGFVGTFALLSAAALAVMGVALARVESAHDRATAIDNAAASAQLLVQVALQPNITPEDMATGLAPTTVAALDEIFQAGLEDGQIVRIKLWSPEGAVYYSDEHELIGRTFPIGDDLREGLDGELTAEVSDLSAAENIRERQFGRLLEVYVPVRFGNEHVGAFELYVPYAPIAADIAGNGRRLYLILSAGLLLLWAVLFRIVSGASRRIRRDRQELERRAEENRHLAMYDQLTGLPNRLLFNDRIDAGDRDGRARRDRAGRHDPRPRPLQGSERHARATTAATSSSGRSAPGCRASCAPPTPWPGSAATSSGSCSPACTAPSTPTTSRASSSTRSTSPSCSSGIEIALGGEHRDRALPRPRGRRPTT